MVEYELKSPSLSNILLILTKEMKSHFFFSSSLNCWDGDVFVGEYSTKQLQQHFA
jgi:hypothetical protein